MEDRLTMQTYKRNDVLEFYEKLQFNETSTPLVQAKKIKQCNSIEVIYPDTDELYYTERIVEYGCGAGWFANSLAYYYGCTVEAVDFNPRAIEMAKHTAEVLGVSDRAKFTVGDLFTYETPPANLVLSNGCLHHTSDCIQGIRKIIRDVKVGGVLFIGLYHKYGRKPFLDYFNDLKKKGLSKKELFGEYRRLDGRTDDDTQALSWFMDQVMHPHETQHTLKEVVNVFEECGVKLEKTSVNNYNRIDNMNELFEMEKDLLQVGEKYLREGKYYPGFFYCKGIKENVEMAGNDLGGIN